MKKKICHYLFMQYVSTCYKKQMEFPSTESKPSFSLIVVLIQSTNENMENLPEFPALFTTTKFEYQQHSAA